MKFLLFKLLSIVFILLLAGTAKPDYFGIDPSRNIDTVYFRSTAKLEFIQGKTHNLTGFFRFDPNNSNDSIHGVLKVDLQTLKTGIDTRDRHMRERNLETDKFPYAYFELSSVTNLPEKLQIDTIYRTTGDGWFYIHGFKRRLKPQLEISMSEKPSNINLQPIGEGSIRVRGAKEDLKLPSGSSKYKAPEVTRVLHINAKFEIHLDDYKISRPKALFLKLAKVVQVEVIFNAFNDLATLIKPPDWPEPD